MRDGLHRGRRDRCDPTTHGPIQGPSGHGRREDHVPGPDRAAEIAAKRQGNPFAESPIRGGVRPALAPTGMRVKSSPVGPLPPGIEERFLEAGGVRFRYLSSAGRTSGAGSVSPIFFLHGYPTWAEVWLPLAAALGPRRPWIALDLPDHNRSGPLPESDRSVSAYRRAGTPPLHAPQPPKAIVRGRSLCRTPRWVLSPASP